MSVLFQTSKGDFVIDLYTDLCPRACKNFISLCLMKKYNNCIFYNVQKGFIIQTGDPTNTGKGGMSAYGYLYGDQAKYFEDEIHEDLKHKKKGLVGMANIGKNTNTSQFYITTTDRHLDYLDGKHTIFGEVAEGMETIMKINDAYTDDNGRPYQIIRIKHTIVLIDPYEDDPLPMLKEHIPPKSPDPSEIQGVEGMLGENEEDVDPNKGRTEEEIEEALKKKEARSRAVFLEAIGDIPDADIKPPENVLFVCKLNPVTRDEDLELIFSRFGKINSCEIIRDRKTGESLCYAFIEFEEKKACEEAFLKMENVLIDDRRIHVDFSQSVAKLWNMRRRGDRMPKYQVDPSQWEVRGSKEKNSESKDTTAKNEGYVFSDDDEEERPRKRKKEKSKKKKKRKYDSDDERRHKRRKRSRSRERGRSRERDRERDRGRSRERSRSRERKDDRYRSSRRKRSRSRERHRSRERSRSRERRDYRR